MRLIHPISSDLIKQLVAQSQKATTSYLYAGKMGYAITLFGLSRAVNDEQLGETAFSLLQQSLVASSQHIGFEQGLAGLGYGLLHLIDTEHIEADFMHLFGGKVKIIQHSLETIDSRPMELLSLQHMPLFLHRLRPHIKDNNWIEEAIKKIMQGIELYLSLQFHDWCEIDYIGNRTFVLQMMQNYLKVVYAINYQHPSRVVLESYSQLYLHHHIPSSLTIGAYLYHLSEKQDHPLYQDVAKLHLYYGAQKTHIDYRLLIALIDDLQALHLTQAPHKLHIDTCRKELAQTPIWRELGLLKYINHIVQPNYLF